MFLHHSSNVCRLIFLFTRAAVRGIAPVPRLRDPDLSVPTVRIEELAHADSCEEEPSVLQRVEEAIPAEHDAAGVREVLIDMVGEDVELVHRAFHDHIHEHVVVTDVGELRSEHQAVRAGSPRRRGAGDEDFVDIGVNACFLLPEAVEVGFVPHAEMGHAHRGVVSYGGLHEGDPFVARRRFVVAAVAVAASSRHLWDPVGGVPKSHENLEIAGVRLAYDAIHLVPVVAISSRVQPEPIPVHSNPVQARLLTHVEQVVSRDVSVDAETTVADLSGRRRRPGEQGGHHEESCRNSCGSFCHEHSLP